MKLFNSFDFELDTSFSLKTVAEVTELLQHDMIYVYHHLNPGDEVDLKFAGTNLKGDIRYQVFFKTFLLGYVTLGGYFRSYFEDNSLLRGRISSVTKEKYLPISQLDVELDIIKLKNAS
ncbi:MAG: hypothetical protein IPM74_18240 [Crocinitomicaceae bacterium]|nr:hypothetical protein [Crocinitomicaceae bacterium]MBK8927783.1 hypothetical protein [Crocinitomicaceae bacterium]